MFHGKAQGRPEKNPLDLNNLPDDYTRDGKLVFEEGSSSGSRKKKSGGKDGKDECGKGSVRSCYDDGVLPMKRGHVMKTKLVSQRETETLNRARQLVFNNDNLATQGHLGCDPTLPFRSVYPPRMFPGSSSTLMPPPQPYLQPYPAHSINDYYVGHVLGSGSSQYPQQNLNYLGPQDSNYTCIGAPVGHGFGPNPSRSGADASLSNQEEGLNWGRSYAGGTQQRLENPSAINRFQDGF
ncbi:hypothetical protein V6N11_033340 [Hibiscus sabdariffa]|uniref:Uncharacterized protein n=1 Tax=Hibiscus sabdariffa TaxID=183260 RepID=A0ABR2PXV0_9ROSI